MDSKNFRPVFMMGPQDTQSGLSLALYFEESDFTRLLALVQKFGMLKVYKHGQDFYINLGNQNFLATNRLKTASLSLVDAQQFEPKDAEGLLSLADLLFYERKHPFKIKAEHLDDEFLVWIIARELSLAIEANDPEQAVRFHEWEFEEEQRKRLIFSQSREAALNSDSKGFTRALNQHDLTLSVETIEVMRLLEVLVSLEMINIYYQGNDFVLALPEMDVSVSKDFHKCTINFGNIPHMTPGAGELIAKIIDLLFYDRKQRNLRFEIANNPEAEAILYQAFTQQNITAQAMGVEQAKRFQIVQKSQNAGLFNQAPVSEKKPSNGPSGPNNR